MPRVPKMAMAREKVNFGEIDFFIFLIKRGLTSGTLFCKPNYIKLVKYKEGWKGRRYNFHIYPSRKKDIGYEYENFIHKELTLK